MEDVIIIDLGDPFRFDQYRKFLSPEQAAALQAPLVAEALSFVGRLAETKKRGYRSFSGKPPHPGRPPRAEQGRWLTPPFCALVRMKVCLPPVLRAGPG